METLKAVIQDLLAFVISELFGRNVGGGLMLETSPSVERAIQVRPTTPLAKPLSKPIAVAPASGAQKSFNIAVKEAPLFSSPVVTFDGVVKLLSFGTSVLYRQRQNRWLEVEVDGIRGWILADNVSAEQVMPQFLADTMYDAEHEVTKKVRAFIQNEFYGSELEVPLQNVEYVSYRLQKKGKHIPWGTDRPRTPGAWQRLLRGKSGVHIGITPRTDSVMEIINEDETGHVAYVDAVFPNQSILVSEISSLEPGSFNGYTLERDEWRELRPIFIDIT